MVKKKSSPYSNLHDSYAKLFKDSPRALYFASIINIVFSGISVSYLLKLKQKCSASNTILNKVTLGMLAILGLTNLYTLFVDPCIGLGYGIFTHIFIAHLYQMKYKCPDVDVWERNVFEGFIWFSVATTIIFTFTTHYIISGACHDALKEKKSKK